MNLLERIVFYFTKWRIKSRCQAQIQGWLSATKIFKAVEIDEAFCADLETLRRKGKFKDLLSSADEALVRVREHNQTVAVLEKDFEAFLEGDNFQKILQKLSEASFGRIQKIHECAKKVSRYELPSDFPKRQAWLNYTEKIGELFENFPTALEEAKTIQAIEASLPKLGADYLDAETAEKAFAKARELTRKLELQKPRFYKAHRIGEELANENNEQFIKAHLNDEIFENVNGNVLDEEQRRAILADPKANLVIAGAGAGKTLTICGKLKWLVETRRATSGEILLLSYSKNSAKDLAAKVRSLNLLFQDFKVKTFHALGKEILEASSGKRQTVDEQFKSHIANFFTEHLVENRETANDVFTFYSLYLRPNKPAQKQYADEGERFADLKAADFHTLKFKLRNMRNPKSRETIKEEVVKSYEELVLANFLFVNGVKYEYERAYEIETSTPEHRQYTPDFYLPQYGVYLEHYGIDKDGRAPQYSPTEEKRYLDGMSWKRNTHKTHGTICLETYSCQFSEGTIFESLEQQLKEHGVELKPMTPDTISRALQNLFGEGIQDFSAFKNLLHAFLSHYKARYTDSKGFETLKPAFGSRYEDDRARLFLKIAQAAYEYYEGKLRGEGKIDFDDMILQAIPALDKLQTYRYRYIIVDEFQDISRSRAKFLQKLIKHGDSKLFAVGDDWQAIYRFAGCDVNIFLHFGRHFKDAKLNFITSTHRNSAELAAIATPFITANPAQIKKKIRSKIHEENPVRILYHEGDRAQAFREALAEIQSKKPAAEILVLGRNNCELENIKKAKTQTSRLKLTYKTVHGSKGLESDFVILLSGDEAKNGFPNKMEDDEILEMLLDEKDTYAFAEERRLFYVALTRTRSLVYILANKERPSSFVLEIEGKAKTKVFGNVAQKGPTCPWCKSGILKLRAHENQKFYGCSNYPYCKYRIKELWAVKKNNLCPRCGDFLVARTGKSGSSFLGCHGYPSCKFTKKLR